MYPLWIFPLCRMLTCARSLIVIQGLKYNYHNDFLMPSMNCSTQVKSYCEKVYPWLSYISSTHQLLGQRIYLTSVINIESFIQYSQKQKFLSHLTRIAVLISLVIRVSSKYVACLSCTLAKHKNIIENSVNKRPGNSFQEPITITYNLKSIIIKG